MSDTSAQAEHVNAGTPELGGVPLLRQARERAGLHVVALAAMLKVPVHKLEALEAGRFDELPDATFTRALASSVCRVLKMDPAPVLASLPQPKGVRLVEEGMGINAPFPQSSRREAVGVEPSAAARQLSKPGVAALVLLFLAAVLWFVLPDDGTWNVMNLLSPADGGAAPSAVSQTPADGNATSPSLEGAVAVMPVAASVSQDSSSTVSSPQSQPSAPVATPAETPVVAAPSEVTPVVQAEAAGVQPLTMRAKEASWVQVTGASGRVLVQRSLQAGEVLSVATDLPLNVVVGRADETEVRVRGAVFDLAPYSRNNVARFEVR